MMDADTLFPNGFHPVKRDMDPTATFKAKRLPRSQGEVMYYFTDVMAGVSFSYLAYVSVQEKERVAYRARNHDPAILDLIHYSDLTADLWNVSSILSTQLYNVRFKFR